MNYIVLCSKGGVGKSTFASQVLANYLYTKNKKPTRLIEIDDENKDSLTFVKSEIIKCEIIPTSRISTIDEIFYDKEDTIIDVGGNKTTTQFLENLSKVGVFDNITFFVPLVSGEQDNLNALETYKNIKAIDDKANIIFVLSRVLSDDLEWEFLHFFGNEYLDTELAIMNQLKDVKYITIAHSNVINNSRTFNKTIKDISMNESDFRAKAISESDKKKRAKFIFLNRVKNEAIEYINYLDNVNLDIEKFIKG